MKIGLICEGGGTKGAYTAGVLSCFIDNDIKFPYCVGISSGTLNLMGFLSNQTDYLENIAVNIASNPELIGLKTILREGQIYGINRLFELIDESIPFNKMCATNNPMLCETGVYHIESGEIHYFQNDALISDNRLAKASCALLMLAKPVTLNGEKYMDAGLKVMIPIERSIQQGNEKHIFISTKEENFVRKKAPLWQNILCKLCYPNATHIQNDLKLRDERYLQQWNVVKKLENEGKAIVLRPSKDMGIKRSTQDKTLLLEWYKLGYEDTLQKLELIREFMNKKSD